MAVSSKKHCACGVLIVAWLSSNLGAQLPVTQLRVLYPPVAHVGGTSTVEVLGQGPLEEIDRLIFSHPGLSANVAAGESNPLTGATQKQFGKFTLSVSSDVTPGFYEAWASGRHGASSSRTIWIAPRPPLNLPQTASDQTAVDLPLDGLVVDRYAAAKVHRYQIALSTGQEVRLTVLDTKLDSRAISQLRVLAPNSKPVAAARSKGIDGAVARFTAAQTGNYLIELRDVAYRGGDEFFYGLWAETAEAPRVDSSATPWTDRSQVLAALAPPAGQLSPARQLASLSIGRWVATELPFIVHNLNASGSDAGRKSLAVTAPCLIAGNFTGNPLDQAFEFTAKKGDVYWIDVASEQIGQRSDAHLSIFKRPPTADENASESASGGGEPAVAKAERILEQDDAPAIGSPPFRINRLDPSVRFESPADATYRVVVRDQFASSTASAGSKYLLAIRKPQPSLSVLAAWAFPTNNAALARPIGNSLWISGASAISVLVDRVDGLAGPIEISCEGLPAGVVAPPIIIPADRNDGHLILTNADQPAAFTGALKIVGRAMTDSATRAEAVAAELIWEPIPTWNALTHRLSQQLVLAVSDKDTMPISIQVGGSDPLVMARGGKLPLPVKLTRRAGGNDKVVLRPQSLPAKTVLAEVPIEAAASEAKPELAIAADAVVGEATLWFQAETKVKIRNNPQALQRAEAEQAELEKMLADPTRAPQKDAIAAAIQAATARVTQLKELTKEVEQAVFLPSNSVRIKIVDGPVEAATVWRIEAARGSESDHPLALNRLFGFDDLVQLTHMVDPAAAGVELAPATFEKSAQQTSCHVKIAADAALGERKLQMKLAYKFNNQDLSLVLPLIVAVRE